MKQKKQISGDQSFEKWFRAYYFHRRDRARQDRKKLEADVAMNHGAMSNEEYFYETLKSAAAFDAVSFAFAKFKEFLRHEQYEKSYETTKRSDDRSVRSKASKKTKKRK